MSRNCNLIAIKLLNIQKCANYNGLERTSMASQQMCKNKHAKRCRKREQNENSKRQTSFLIHVYSATIFILFFKLFFEGKRVIVRTEQYPSTFLANHSVHFLTPAKRKQADARRDPKRRGQGRLSAPNRRRCILSLLTSLLY